LTTQAAIGQVGRSILSWLCQTWQPNGGHVIEELGAVVATARGLVRSDNQDRCLIARSRAQGWLCFIVCDGIGGMPNGGPAAEIAACRFIEALVEDRAPDTKGRLIRAVESANAEVHRRYTEKGGTTLAAVILDRSNSFYGVSAGDSRIYAASGKTRVEQVSTDDTIAGELQRIKGINIEPENVDPTARQLAQYVGMGPGIQPRTYDLMRDQSGPIVLCTDGVHSIPSRTFEQVTLHAPTPYKLGTRLIQISEWLGGFDNASLIVIPSVLKAISREDEPTRDDTVEVWSPFGKVQILILQMDQKRHLHDPTVPRDDEASKTKELDNIKPRNFEPPGPPPKRKQDRKRPPRKAEKSKPAPQLGMELIENAEIQPAPSDPASGPVPEANEGEKQKSSPVERVGASQLVTNVEIGDIQSEPSTRQENVEDK
jgi:serine/threonine protein phosphatase PrpC